MLSSWPPGAKNRRPYAPTARELSYQNLPEGEVLGAGGMNGASTAVKGPPPGRGAVQLNVADPAVATSPVKSSQPDAVIVGPVKVNDSMSAMAKPEHTSRQAAKT